MTFMWLAYCFFPLFLAVLFAIPIWLSRKRYYKSAYERQTGKSFWAVSFDSGAKGEYHLGLQLERFAPDGHPLFNIYIPKGNGKTSEIDALLITSETIFVFENKNYSGWIFGNATQKTWTQTLNKKSKYRFYNPVMQNAGHIKALSNYLGLPIDAFTGIVVFADKAVFKKVNSGESVVVHTKDVCHTLGNLSVRATPRFSIDEASAIYEKLSACTRVDAEVKNKHIAEVRKFQH